MFTSVGAISARSRTQRRTRFGSGSTSLGPGGVDVLQKHEPMVAWCRNRHRTTSTPPVPGRSPGNRFVVAAAARGGRSPVLPRHTVKEAATAMKCREGTVRALTSQAIAALRASGLGVDDE